MSSTFPRSFERSRAAILVRRLQEPRRFLQVVAGPRQVGKTTLVGQVLERCGLASLYASADEPTLRGREWLGQQWDAARLLCLDRKRAVLVVDEVQKVPDWAEAVKAHWDADTSSRTPLAVVLLGSAPLLVQQGLTESLAGRFETIHLPHWTLPEMRDAFGWDLDRFVFYGGYPGAAPLVEEPERWTRYVLDSLVETTVSRDVLLLQRVDKPALLRRLFHLSCGASGQIVSYTKMLGTLKDAGNATTLAHYLDLLGAAGMVTGLPKFTGGVVRQRGSSPKLQVLNNALVAATSGLSFEAARGDPSRWGRFVESAVGAHLANAAAAGVCEVSWWRERNREVDFVVKAGRTLVAIEVKSGRATSHLPGMAAFAAQYRPNRTLLVGGDGIPVDEFLSRPVEHWIRA